MYSYDVYELTSHSSMYVLSLLSSSKIKISNFTIKDKYLFSFESSIYNRKKIKKIFPSIKRVESKGILNLLLKGLLSKVIVISLIISCVFYAYLSSFIWKININGNNDTINMMIIEKLDENNIEKGEKLVSSSKLKFIENKIYDQLKNNIEWLEIKRKGCSINVAYLKRREELGDVESRGKLYASRDGIIQTINIESGVVKVKENQYVRKGDLLVDDIIEVSSGGINQVKTIGNIIATTWYIINVELDNVFDDEASMFEYALLKGNDKIEGEVTNIVGIVSQNILKYEFSSSIIKLRIHYAILEDISVEG